MAVSGKTILVLLLCVMVAKTVEGGTITCQMVVRNLSPCMTYLTKEGPVPNACCMGIQSLYNTAYDAASTTTDRQTACNCLEKTASLIPNLKLEAAGSLPGKCGVSIPYKISPETDCTTVE
ncbi:hypothetical protein LXL04_002146 [Taraxacum kok-saghyz]